MSDLSAVTLDFRQVGLDEILDFCARHRSEFRSHLLSLKALLTPAPNSRPVAERRAALLDEAHRLLELQRRRWTNVGGVVSLGLIGAAWTLASGDLLGALIGGAGTHLHPDGRAPVSAYAYILRPEIELAAWRESDALATPATGAVGLVGFGA